MFQPKRPGGLAVANSKVLAKISAAVLALVLASGAVAPATNAATANPQPAKVVAKVSGTFDIGAHPINHADSLWVVVNKIRPLIPLKYAPVTVRPNFALPSTNNPYSLTLAKPSALAIVILAKAMKAAGAGDLVLQSGYRSFGEQTYVHNHQVQRYGLKAGEALAARPGYSEHQTGLAADVSALGQGCVIQACFGKTVAGTWLRENAWRYGFIVRYPKGKTAITGYDYEPWHIRYLGKALTEQMHKDGVTVLEKFFGLPSAPAYRN
jgi:D-alanyl-D-alanine carboxypeptidase